MPQEYNEPSFFVTMCGGEAQGLDAFWQMPIVSMSRKIFLVACSLSGARRRSFENMGRSRGLDVMVYAVLCRCLRSKVEY